ncbi:cobalamin B12-binding domain-containing protein [Candidatus Nitrospira allomarina]|uniref:Cobalamin-dependent protein n=1 Tax=Candidatus Nitrospira allomarina TaxID=3020900 RepID=A0AA96GD08_9BACT|nr:cobalamin-dependent protein [Candidatus Nitrospira allomarina]WNM56688.1 cobalamin-dependent protein [Candidatus Nitrospira allomarina]
MKDVNNNDRHRLAEKLKFLEGDVIEVITTQFFQHHPETGGYGESGKAHCATDAHYHLTFLRTAIEFGTEETFRQYVRWTTNVLQARNISQSLLQKFLHQISHALEPHLTDSEKKVVRAHLIESPHESLRPEAPPAPHPRSPLALHQEVFLQALLAGNRHAAGTIAFEAFSMTDSLSDVYVELFQESLYEIGRLWESNRISVAQEHVATAITQYVMANVYPRVKPAQPFQGKGIITGVEGELHQVGSHMVADLLESQGWDIRFLGVNIPHQAILQMIKEFRPTLVGISATMVLKVPIVRDLINDIRTHFPPEYTPRILVGGSAFRSLPDVFREIGADGFAYDLRSLTSLLA